MKLYIKIEKKTITKLDDIEIENINFTNIKELFQ